MEHIFLSILQQIEESMPQLSLVDEDYGQLETTEDTYPVTFPCVLLSNIDCNWSDLGNGAQKGECTITARLIIDCYDDTHIGSTSEDRIIDRLLMSKELYKVLQCFRPDPNMGPLYRVKSRDFTIAHGIKVYEQVYSFEYHDESAYEV